MFIGRETWCFENYDNRIEKPSLSSIVIVIFEKPGLSKTMTIESKNQVYQIAKPGLSNRKTKFIEFDCHSCFFDNPGLSTKTMTIGIKLLFKSIKARSAAVIGISRKRCFFPKSEP